MKLEYAFIQLRNVLSFLFGLMLIGILNFVFVPALFEVVVIGLVGKVLVKAPREEHCQVSWVFFIIIEVPFDRSFLRLRVAFHRSLKPRGLGLVLQTLN
jgi:hypothetical protein